MIADNTPVIIGVGQSVEWIGAEDYAGRSAADLAAQAARAAIADAGANVSGLIDAIAAVRTFDDSFPFVPPFGVPDKFPRATARRLGINPVYAVLAPIGGHTPIALIGQMGARIAAGKTSVALIVGSEAISTVRHLTNLGQTRDWTEQDDGEVDDPGAQLEEIVKPYQVIHGLRGAAATYGLIENARRGRLGLSKADYAAAMGDLFAPFARVAAANPYSSPPVEAMTAQDITEISARNRMVADPYPVRLCARDQVNQGAAVLMTSVGQARALGISESQWIFVQGLAIGTERDLIDRPDLDAAPMAIATINAAMAQADRVTADLTHFDFYSCFPIAVFASAIDGLGMAPDDRRGLTVTGGLPFFGGPGNNYSTHAVATMVQRLRGNPGAAGLVFANGGQMSKSGAVVFSAAARAWHDPVAIAPETGKPVPVNWHPSGPGQVLTYTVVYTGGRPVRAIVIGVLDKGGDRFIAIEADAQTLAHCVAGDPLGAAIVVSSAADGNRFTFA
jgi:acetyl-CoA C-acetyltransferase